MLHIDNRRVEIRFWRVMDVSFPYQLIKKKKGNVAVPVLHGAWLEMSKTDRIAS